MAGITLVDAEAKLAMWMAAESALATSQSYEIEVEGNRRSLTRADLADVAERIDYWNGWVNRLTAQATGRGRSRTIVN